MSADVFAKMMNWISAFVAKIVDLFKQLGKSSAWANQQNYFYLSETEKRCT